MSGCNLLFLQIPGETARAELDVDTVLPGGERFLRRCPGGLLSGGRRVAVSAGITGGRVVRGLVRGGGVHPPPVPEDGTLLLGQSGTVRES